MQPNNLVIWSNDDFRPDQSSQQQLLVDGVGPHRLLQFERHDPRSIDALAAADIAYGAPDPNAVVTSNRLRWIHLNSAGYTPFDTQQIKQAFQAQNKILTTSSAVYSEPCAQHLLAMMLTLARQIPAALDSQRRDCAWPMKELRAASRLLDGQTVVLLGYGAIARRLIELLRPFNLSVIAVRTRIEGDEDVTVVETSKVDSCLAHADHLVNTLPANDETKNFLDGGRLRSLKPGAIVYNIGRGTTLDASALNELLREGHIAAAYLDVTDPEPLPPDHPLWQTPNCFITPHTGGGHSNEKERQIKHFLENLRRFECGEPLLNRVV
ncbi:MAG: D-2-hydroxyacid dehydrogenase [Blastocatellia bacterium]|nr:MAG: D-2-hydroxyacid dehydrogenase [Blastocatellia bacterium]